MRAIEHVYADGTSSFEYIESTYGEWKAMRAQKPEDMEAWIRANCSIDTVHNVPVRPEPDDDAPYIVPARTFGRFQ